jgi:REP element-mobilizing transposase RayT
MPHTYTNLLVHALFSTKDRQPWLPAEVREEIFSYLGGAVNELGGQSLWVNGPKDHVHMLFVQPRVVSIATLMEKVKANSSGWVKKRWQNRGYFGWQTGYAAFSVSRSHVEQLRRYIRNQEEHHRKVTFQEEVVAFLDKHGIEYDPRYVFA